MHQTGYASSQLKFFILEIFERVLSVRNFAPLLACVSVLLINAGCQRASKPERAAQKDSPEVFKPARATQAQIFADEAMWRPPYAIIGGTVENISAEKLDDLFVELELQRRDDGASERRQVEVVPRTIPPGEKGRYSLKVLRDEWSGSKLVGLRSSSPDTEIVFKSMPGARRPPERVPQPTPITRIVQVPRPKPRPQGEEYINTPDNPEKVP